MSAKRGIEIPNMVLVLAGSYEQFRDYISRHGLYSERVRYLHDVRRLVATNNVAIVAIGTWQDRCSPQLRNEIAYKVSSGLAVKWSEHILLQNFWMFVGWHDVWSSYERDQRCAARLLALYMRKRQQELEER